MEECVCTLPSHGDSEQAITHLIKIKSRIILFLTVHHGDNVYIRFVFRWKIVFCWDTNNFNFPVSYHAKDRIGPTPLSLYTISFDAVCQISASFGLVPRSCWKITLPVWRASEITVPIVNSNTKHSIQRLKKILHAVIFHEFIMSVFLSWTMVWRFRTGNP